MDCGIRLRDRRALGATRLVYAVGGTAVPESHLLCIALTWVLVYQGEVSTIRLVDQVDTAELITES